MQTSVIPSPRTIRLSDSLYPPAALAKAREAFSQVCRIDQDVWDGGTVLTLAPVEGAPAETVDEFLSYALCAALEIHLAELV